MATREACWATTTEPVHSRAHMPQLEKAGRPHERPRVGEKKKKLGKTTKLTEEK